MYEYTDIDYSDVSDDFLDSWITSQLKWFYRTSLAAAMSKEQVIITALRIHSHQLEKYRRNPDLGYILPSEQHIYETQKQCLNQT